MVSELETEGDKELRVGYKIRKLTLIGLASYYKNIDFYC